jgi:hypothetical protein
MGKSDEDFGDKLKILAEISELIENEDSFKGGDVELRFRLPKEKYDKILRNFREIDWNSDKFYINIGETSFKFVLKK